MVLAAAAFMGMGFPAAAYAAAPLRIESTPTPAPPTTAAPIPTTHSYDDTHTDQRREGSSLVLWILAGAAFGLGGIAVILVRAGPSPRHQIPRSQ